MAQWVGRGIALVFHDRGTRGGEWSAARPSRTLSPVNTWYPFYRRLGEPQVQSGWEENLVLTGIQSRTVLHSQSLYRLSYPDHPRCQKGSRKIGFPDYMTIIQDGGKVIKEIMFC